MSLKLKALSLSLLAAMAVSAIVVANASATAGGHFVTTGNSHAHIKGSVGGTHNLHLFSHPQGSPGEEIGCTTQSYTATTTTETTTSITVTPTFASCHTTGSPGTNIPVTVNGCTYTFTVNAGPPATTEHTVHLLCPAGQKIEIHHPNCTTSIHPQTPTGNLTYTTTGEGNGHEITMDVNVTFSVTTHGLCQFVKPTNSFGTLIGSVTVKAFHPVTGVQIPITAT
jgi:hypothetical protein